MNQLQKIEKGNQMRKRNKINKINQVFASILLSGAIFGGAISLSPVVRAEVPMMNVSTQGKVMESDPNIFTEEVGSRFFKLMKEKQAQIKQNPNTLKAIVEENLMPYVNVRYIGAKIMGIKFKSFSEEDRQRYFQKLEKYLISNYAQVFTLYKGQDVKYVKVPYNNEEIVRTNVQVIQSQGNPIHVFFSLRKNTKTNEWQLFDITSEGISFVESKTGEWKENFKSNDKFEKLLQYLDDVSQSNISIAK